MTSTWPPYTGRTREATGRLEINSDLVEEKTKDGYDLVNASNAWRARMAKDTGNGKQFALEAGDEKMALNLTATGTPNRRRTRQGRLRPRKHFSWPAPASECKAEKNKASWKVTDLFSLDYIVTDVAVEQLIRS